MHRPRNAHPLIGSFPPALLSSAAPLFQGALFFARATGPRKLHRREHGLAATGTLRAVDRALIQFICVRKTHRRKPPVDPSSPFNVAEEGGWAYCPGGEPDSHKWFKTGGITRAAL